VAYCPKCRYEYEIGVLICPDCNEPLVDQLPPEKTAAMTPDRDWVAVGSVASEMKAEIAKGSLDSSNIPSLVLSSNFSAYGRGMDFQSGLMPSLTRGNVVMVPREYREAAALILEAVLGDDLIGLE